MVVGVLDYGAGNIYSVLCGLKRAGIKSKVLKEKRYLKDIDALVIPGVGSFSQAANSIITYRDTLCDFVNEGRYILGICLGMQILLERSEEGQGEGLGLVKGEVKQLPSTVKVPHMGWNSIEILKDSEIFNGLTESPYFYFVHSFAVHLSDSIDVSATTEYGDVFASAIERDSVIGLQFHPEKSGKNGALLLNNFCEMISR